MTRAVNMDMKLIKPLLYYQCADLGAHRVSSNLNKLYELVPKIKKNYGKKKVEINSFGYRDKERGMKKPKGTFQIVFFGGSNTFGAEVNNDETYPAYMEKELNSKTKVKFEVWNAGCDAYEPLQNIEDAKLILTKYDPDLLVFQITNRGRRGFMLGADYTPYFRKNPELYWENLSYIPFVSSSLGKWIFLNFSSYRTLVILMNRINQLATMVTPNNMHYDLKDNLDGRMLADFYANNYAKCPIIIWEWKSHSGSPDGGVFSNFGKFEYLGSIFQKKYLPSNVEFDPEYATMNSRSAVSGNAFFLIHPPAYVYKWYAETLIKEFIDKGLITMSNGYYMPGPKMHGGNER